MTQESTIEYYHARKDGLMRAIIRSNMPVLLSEKDEVFCQNCRLKKSEVEEMHIEHPNGNGRPNLRSDGGWQKLYKYEKDYREGEQLWVVCLVCHYLLHRSRDDGHGERLKRRHKILQEYDDKDPDFLLRQRHEKGGDAI